MVSKTLNYAGIMSHLAFVNLSKQNARGDIWLFVAVVTKP